MLPVNYEDIYSVHYVRWTCITHTHIQYTYVFAHGVQWLLQEIQESTSFLKTLAPYSVSSQTPTSTYIGTLSCFSTLGFINNDSSVFGTIQVCQVSWAWLYLSGSHLNFYLLIFSQYCFGALINIFYLTIYYSFYPPLSTNPHTHARAYEVCLDSIHPSEFNWNSRQGPSV